MANKETKTLEQLKEEAAQAQKAYELAKKLADEKEKEEAERKKAELAAEKSERQKEIEQAKEHYITLVRQFIKDYGSYASQGSYKPEDDFITLLFDSNPFKFFL
mgnify:CR=1 FL=1